MSFISSAFLLFLPVVFIGYWALQHGSLRMQNLFLLLASYVFYAWGDWRFLALLIANSLVTYVVAQAIQNSTQAKHRKALLLIGIVFGVGTLGFFKYYNFFADSVIRSLGLIGVKADVHTLKLILPLGISYFTFKSISYMIEVFRGKLPATDDYVSFFTYIGFFPQLVAGPIDRPSNLLVQIQKPRHLHLEGIYLGFKQGLWGLFKKIVVADTLAKVVDPIFAGYATLPGPELMIGAVFYSIQIYCDFSGYTDIANGCARALGFQPMENFARPYFSRDIAEFWRRWHMSLMTWFRDYIFYPLGGGIGSKWKAIRNTLVTFTLSGLWHGANWTFVVWGFLHGLLFLPLIYGIQNTHPKKIAYKRLLPNLDEAWRMALTFALVTALWVVFRADTLAHAVGYLLRCVTAFSLHGNHFDFPKLYGLTVAGAMILVEWQKREVHTPLDVKYRYRIVRWLAYSLIVVAIIFLGNFDETPFLYAQF